MHVEVFFQSKVNAGQHLTRHSSVHRQNAPPTCYGCRMWQCTTGFEVQEGRRGRKARREGGGERRRGSKQKQKSGSRGGAETVWGFQKVTATKLPQLSPPLFHPPLPLSSLSHLSRSHFLCLLLVVVPYPPTVPQLLLQTTHLRSTHALSLTHSNTRAGRCINKKQPRHSKALSAWLPTPYRHIQPCLPHHLL